MSVEVGYWAGLFDGEGCVIFRVSERNTLNTFLQLSNTHRPTLDELCERYGGLVSFVAATNIWVWRAAGETAVAFALEILPHLKIKKRQVELWLLGRSNVRYGRIHSEEEWNRRRRIARKIKVAKGARFDVS
jgi:hypothetical protein